MMSWFQTSVHYRDRDKNMLIATLVAVFLLSTAVGQQKNDDLDIGSTKNEHITYIMYCIDGWFSRDKLYHFLAGFTGTMTISGGLRNSLDTPVKNSVSMASAGIFSIGFLKETYDRKQPNNHSCWKDLTADFFGIVLGAWLWLAVTGDEMEKM